MNTVELHRVHYMPRELKPGILYVSEEFAIAGHMCPCGCGNKIITPLGATDWSLTIEDGKPTLFPSIGNWQIPCKSHYWIDEGTIKWSYQWSEKQILAGRKREEQRRKVYYNNLEREERKASAIMRFINWLFGKTKNGK